jgi:hypothetical protein
MASYTWKRDGQELGTAAGLYPFAGATGIGAVAAPTTILGSIALTPAALAAVGAVAAPGVILGSITFAPAALAAIGVVVAPSVILGSLALGPAALAAVGAVVAPTTILGSITVTPAALAAVAAVAHTGVTVPLQLTLRDRRSRPGDANIRGVGHVARQGANESIVYQITTTPWTTAPESAAVAVYDRSADDADVTADVLPAGDPVARSGAIITLPRLGNVIAHHWYRVAVLFNGGNQQFECYFVIVGEE